MGGRNGFGLALMATVLCGVVAAAPPVRIEPEAGRGRKNREGRTSHWSRPKFTKHKAHSSSLQRMLKKARP